MKCRHVYHALLAAAIVPWLKALVIPTPTSTQSTLKLGPCRQRCLYIQRRKPVCCSQSQDDLDITSLSSEPSNVDAFDLNVALFCGGLAFDPYVEPPSNSTRWEKGSKGMNVAFLSQAFTRSLYKGLVEITPIKCSGLPEEDDQLESFISGGGVDASIMVAAIEGQWKEDVALLKQGFHEGILDLSGAAHIGKSSTAWSNIDERRSIAEKKKTGKAPPYHIKKTWGKDASAVWPEPDPFYIYVQDPANVLLLFTLFDDDIIGDGSAIGSTFIPLSKILPQVTYSQDETIKKLKSNIVEKIRRGEADPNDIDEEVVKAVQAETQAWEGDLKLTSKPRIKNKNSQIAVGATVGAFVAGPVGAALGAGLGSMYEGQVKGRITTRIRYLPIPKVSPRRNRYVVTGGMPGIDWGSLYEMYLEREVGDIGSADRRNPGGNDLEHCFFINHSETGACCAVYRSLAKKLIVISFRGTCAPIDLVTDASIAQDTWIEGQEPKNPETPMVHVGFRRSLNSISRRLKELILAAVGPGDSIADYDILVTGHSLGGALATLFTADIGEYGFDAGRALPTTGESDPWWKVITTRLSGDTGQKESNNEPPRPKSLRVYNFGSPRVGNRAFSKKFDELLHAGKISQAYRVVNGKDVVARMPRTMGALSVDYDHCGKTVLVEAPTKESPRSVLWVENESDDQACPVRDSARLTASPTADGTLLGDLFQALKWDESNLNIENSQKLLDQVGSIASKVTERLSSVTASDISSLVGIDKSFTEREVQMVNALVRGEALAHHMEDSYYSAMANAGGIIAFVGEQIVAASANILVPVTEQVALADVAFDDLDANEATKT